MGTIIKTRSKASKLKKTHRSQVTTFVDDKTPLKLISVPNDVRQKYRIPVYSSIM